MKRKSYVPENVASSIILLLSIILGLVIGSASVAHIDETTASKLLSSITTVGINAETGNLLQTIWDTFKYPFFVFILGFTFLGLIFIPILLALRGYFVSFSIGTLIKLYGVSGLGLSASIFGIQILFSFPCLFVLSLECFKLAKEQLKFLSGAKYSFTDIFLNKHFIYTVLVCICALIFLTLIEFFITPHLIKYAFNYIT